MSKKDESQNLLPEIEDFIVKSEKEETAFYKELFAQAEEHGDTGTLLSGQPSDTENIKMFAAKYQLELPDNLKRGLRYWRGQDAFTQMKKASGAKYMTDFVIRVHDHIPLSLKGYETKKTDTSIQWVKDDKTIEFILGKFDEDLKPAAGDTAKRVLYAFIRFARWRKTLDPGPIEFRELLEILGISGCSQQQRLRIKNYCKSFERCSLIVTKYDKKGRESYHRYAPFFKGFIWDGVLGLDSKIFPIFNEEFERMAFEENIAPYVWLDDKRLKPLKKATDRDRVAQDNFRMIQGIPKQTIYMRTFLYKFGQFTKTEILKMSLANIRDFVNKNVQLAREDSLIEDIKIQRFRKKEKYLNQIISIYPPSPEPHPESYKKRELTDEDYEKIDEFTCRLDKMNVEDYAKIDKKTTYEQLENCAKAGNLDCIEAAFDEVDYEGAEYDLVDDERNFKNRPMKFWDEYRRLAEAKKSK